MDSETTNGQQQCRNGNADNLNVLKQGVFNFSVQVFVLVYSGDFG